MIDSNSIRDKSFFILNKLSNLMMLYKYTIQNESVNELIESGTGELFDLETVIPIEILSILELYEDEEGVITINVRVGDISYAIDKIGLICT